MCNWCWKSSGWRSGSSRWPGRSFVAPSAERSVHFRWFCEYRYAGNARKFFKGWYQWAIRFRLESVKKVARMLKRHLDRILSWFRHHISNGIAEGYNSRIQSIKTAARGFRNFANYRIRILFFCGKLNILPNSTHKYVR